MFTRPMKIHPLLSLGCGAVCAMLSSASWAAPFEFKYYADGVANTSFSPPSPVVIVNGIPLFPNTRVLLGNGVTLIPVDLGNDGTIDEIYAIAPTMAVDTVMSFTMEVPEAYAQGTGDGTGTTTTGSTSITGYDTFHQPNTGGPTDNLGDVGGDNGNGPPSGGGGGDFGGCVTAAACSPGGGGGDGLPPPL